MATTKKSQAAVAKGAKALAKLSDPTPEKGRSLGQPCLCGCGSLTSRSSRRFRQGHDGRLKGRLIEDIRAAARSGDKAGVAKGRKALAALGWDKFAPAV